MQIQEVDYIQSELNIIINLTKRLNLLYVLQMAEKLGKRMLLVICSRDYQRQDYF